MKITKKYIQRLVLEEILGELGPHTRAAEEDPDYFSSTEPKYTVNRTPEDKLVQALIQRAAVDGMSAREAAIQFELGDDDEVIAYIQGLLDNPMLDEPSR